VYGLFVTEREGGREGGRERSREVSFSSTLFILSFSPQVSDTDTNPHDYGEPPITLSSAHSLDNRPLHSSQYLSGRFHSILSPQLPLLHSLQYSCKLTHVSYTYNSHYEYVGSKATFSGNSTIFINALDTVSGPWGNFCIS
jgi:hypothetical protein